MNEVASKAAEGGLSEVLKVLFLQNIGMLLGIGTLFVLAYWQDSIKIGAWNSIEI